ncbi:MAG: LysR substrate-binding domain-containing protein [Granulosicoccaceae bacterium]
MNTEAIRLFVLAAESLNISAAGRRLDLAPAVASARLSKLEREVGADLLHRSTRKVSLSTEGEEFLPYAREILAQEDAARAALGRGTAKVTGTLRFAAPSTFAQRYIAPLLPEFLDQYPDVKLQLSFSDAQTNLIEGGFDLDLRARKLADDRRILCAAPDYLKRFGTPQTPAELGQHRLLTFMHGPTRKLYASDQAASRFPPSDASARIVCDGGASMRIATMSGVGISMNSLWSVYKEIQEGSLVQVLPSHQVDQQSAIWLVYPKSNVLTAKVRVLMDFLIAKIGKHPVWEQ